jgi:putative glutathione S-transferase
MKGGSVAMTASFATLSESESTSLAQVWHSQMPFAGDLRSSEASAPSYPSRAAAVMCDATPMLIAPVYHLYVSDACPFAHRTLLARKVKALDDVISISVLDPDWGGPLGWTFNDGPMATVDHVNGLASLPEVYRKADPHFTGRVTVPALWDKARGTIVNNESAEIMRMLDQAFAAFGDPAVELYPEPLRAEIDRINGYVASRVNAGVYRAGFAATQEAYDAAVRDLFAALDHLEHRLAVQPYLVGGRLTKADLRLFATLVRSMPRTTAR